MCFAQRSQRFLCGKGHNISKNQHIRPDEKWGHEIVLERQKFSVPDRPHLGWRVGQMPWQMLIWDKNKTRCLENLPLPEEPWERWQQIRRVPGSFEYWAERPQSADVQNQQ